MAERIARRTVIGLAAAAALSNAGRAIAQSQPKPIPIKVGAYEFPPYADESGNGVTREFLNLVNAAQREFRFDLVRTSPQRRYDDLEQGRFDLIAFESLAWGWSGRPVDASRVFLRDAEVFVAKAGPGVDQSFFDNLQGKSILGRLGYHYAFAGFNTDPAVLESRYNTRLTVSHEGNLRSVAAGRADLTIVTKSFLARFLMANPGTEPQLLVSDRADQIYDHTILVRRGSPVAVAWVNATLDRLEADGTLPALWERQGIVG